MVNLTSPVAQNQFATLIDASHKAKTQAIPFHVATLISENYPLRGKMQEFRCVCTSQK